MTLSPRAVEAAAEEFCKRGIHIACPGYGDMDDLERERYEALIAAITAYLAALAADGLCLVPESALDQMRHTERKFDLIVKHMVDLAALLPPGPVPLEGSVAIFKDQTPERTLRALQAAVKRALDLASDMSNKRIDAMIAAASTGDSTRKTEGKE